MKNNKYLKKFIPVFRKNQNAKYQPTQTVGNVLSDNTPFVVREAYRTARTNIIFSVSGISESKCKIIAFTSARPGEGKTTTSLNIALTFVKTDAKVLVIEGDLRKPRLHRYLKLKKDVGLSTVLSKQTTAEKAIVKNARPGLDVLLSGELPPNPAELLSSDAMRELLDKLSQDYDYIFIDTPPVSVVTDAAVLSPLIDCVVIVVRQNYTDHEGLTNAINLLNIAKAKILGFFVNDAKSVHESYGYKRYSYKYSYKYGYADQEVKKDKKK